MNSDMASMHPETAASPRLIVELAGLRRRLASLLYECLLLLGVLGLAFILPYVLLGMFFDLLLPGWLMWAHVFALLGLYFVWYWAGQGQTLAMQTWRLKLVRESDGRPLGIGTASLRYVLAWPSVLCLGLGLAWALVDRDRQFLHDRLAGTRVVLMPVSPPD